MAILIQLIMDGPLAPQTPAEKVAQLPLKPLSFTLVESIRRTQSSTFRRYPRWSCAIRAESSALNVSTGREALAVASADFETVSPPR